MCAKKVQPFKKNLETQPTPTEYVHITYLTISTTPTILCIAIVFIREDEGNTIKYDQQPSNNHKICSRLDTILGSRAGNRSFLLASGSQHQPSASCFFCPKKTLRPLRKESSLSPSLRIITTVLTPNIG